jgi:stage III sporulation protein AH
MSNSKKQTIVISVLIVLIVCVSLVARNFNNTVKDSNAISDNVTVASKTLNYFADSRIQKETQFDNSKLQYNEIKDNKELSKKVRGDAAVKLMGMVDTSNKEIKIETLVKGRGFEDALCTITDANVDVCVKTTGEITKEQVNAIKDIIVSATKYSPNNIFVRSKQ